MTTTGHANRINVGDVELHVEMSGSGPAVLLIAGAAGDAGQYEGLARELAADHTVVRYDRRGNSRSERTADWASTTVEQHADDAAALLAVLDIESATVFGNSTGALVALSCVLRAPDRVRTVVLHEPTLMAVLADPDSAMSSVQPVIAAGMEQGGLPGGADAFLGFAAGQAWQAVPAEVRDRMVGNAEVLFQAEFGSFMGWRPDEAQMGANSVPAAVLSAEQTAPFFREAAEWVAQQLGVPVGTTPGGHMGFLEDASGFAQVLRPLLG